MSDEFSTRLADLWRQGGRDLAVGFLRRATSRDQNLADILTALQFAGVEEHLSDITIRDVFGAVSAPQVARPVQPAASKPVTPVKKTRRKRRSSEQMQQMRAQLCEALNNEPDSLDTLRLMQELNDAGHGVDTITVNTLLKSLEAEGRIACSGGKPKAWRAVRAPQTSPTPMFIRRAQNQVNQ